MGRSLAGRGLGLVYGGGHVGLMGEVADAALAAGGEVVGVITEDLQAAEVAHLKLTELHVVGTMHERKASMADRADAFVALPGGPGTFEELFEVVTWQLLGIHDKPCGVLDVDGYFEPLRALLDQTVTQGFLTPDRRQRLLEATNPDVLLDLLEAAAPLPVDGPLGPEAR